jgi:ferredoxin-fold anticodon binding domain-containing protein
VYREPENYVECYACVRWLLADPCWGTKRRVNRIHMANTRDLQNSEVRESKRERYTTKVRDLLP